MIQTKPPALYDFRVSSNTPSSSSALPTTFGAPLFGDVYQDYDPIRRPCVGGQNGGGSSLPFPGILVQPDFPVAVGEQVCGPQNTLGLVLPVRVPVLSNPTADDLYPRKPCHRGWFTWGSAPNLPGTGKKTLCPNGDLTFPNLWTSYNFATGEIVGSSNLCLLPIDDSGDTRCINGKNNFPVPITPPFGQIPAALRDGRVYNLHQYNSGGGYRQDPQLGPARMIVGNFSRIHTTRTLLPTAPTCPGGGGDTRCCAQTDATSQVGCLSAADPCSIGFSGGGSVAQALQTSTSIETTFGASINNIRNAQACVVSAIYPFSRKLFLASVIGFENVTGQELALSQCFTGTASGFNALLAASNVFPLPTGPVCQDFADEACAGAPASNACANNPVGFPQ